EADRRRHQRRTPHVGLLETHGRQRSPRDRRDLTLAPSHLRTLTPSHQAFPYLLLPSFWAARNRMRRRERGDSLRGLLFGGIGIVVVGALFWGARWLTRQLGAYEEFGDYLLRLGLSWLFLSFLAFLAFSGIVTALSSFFLSDDLRLLMTSP